MTLSALLEPASKLFARHRYVNYAPPLASSNYSNVGSNFQTTWQASKVICSWTNYNPSHGVVGLSTTLDLSLNQNDRLWFKLALASNAPLRLAVQPAGGPTVWLTPINTYEMVNNMLFFRYAASSAVTIQSFAIVPNASGNISCTIEGIGVYRDIQQLSSYTTPAIVTTTAAVSGVQMVLLKNGTVIPPELVPIYLANVNYVPSIQAYAVINPSLSNVLLHSDGNIKSVSKNGNDISITLRQPIGLISSIAGGRLVNNWFDLQGRITIISKSASSITLRCFDSQNNINPNMNFVVIVYR